MLIKHGVWLCWCRYAPLSRILCCTQAVHLHTGSGKPATHEEQSNFYSPIENCRGVPLGGGVGGTFFMRSRNHLTIDRCTPTCRDGGRGCRVQITEGRGVKIRNEPVDREGRRVSGRAPDNSTARLLFWFISRCAWSRACTCFFFC